VYSYSTHRNLYRIQSIATDFEINNTSQLAFFGASHFASHILRLNVYRKPHHKFLQNFPVVDVSQVAMWVSPQSSERVPGEGSFAKGFRNVM
jgi:hypothetical protein